MAVPVGDFAFDQATPVAVTSENSSCQSETSRLEAMLLKGRPTSPGIRLSKAPATGVKRRTRKVRVQNQHGDVDTHQQIIQVVRDDGSVRYCDAAIRR